MSLDHYPHPAPECDDPSSCIQHAKAWWSYQGCLCSWAYGIQDTNRRCPAHGWWLWREPRESVALAAFMLGFSFGVMLFVLVTR